MAQNFNAGNAKVNWYGAEFNFRYRRGIAKLLDDVGRGMLGKLRENLLVQGVRGSDGSAPEHSSPGEFPRAISKSLVNSTFMEASQQTDNRFVLKVGFTAKHGLYMEKGIEGGTVIVPRRATVLSWINQRGERVFARKVVQGRIAPRPFMQRTMIEFLPTIRAIMARGSYF